MNRGWMLMETPPRSDKARVYSYMRACENWLDSGGEWELRPNPSVWGYTDEEAIAIISMVVSGYIPEIVEAEGSIPTSTLPLEELKMECIRWHRGHIQANAAYDKYHLGEL